MKEGESCSLDRLKFDEACIVINTQIDKSNLWFYTLSSDCVSCPYKQAAKLIKSKPTNISVNTAYSQIWRVVDKVDADKYLSPSDKDGLYCQVTPEVGQFGEYELRIEQNNSCKLYINKNAESLYSPLLISFGAIVLLLLSLSLIKLIKGFLATRWEKRQRKKQRQDEEPDSEQKQRGAEDKKNKPTKRRILSLDTVRGMSILMMIFVNNGAGGYRFLEHATWDGLLVGDLVFPCFMWIMGVCIPLSISSQLLRGSSKLSLCKSIIKRSIYLFIIGICLNTLGGRNQLERIRIFGVLQRFGICYFFTSITYTLFFRVKTREFKGTIFTCTRDIWILLPQWIVALSVFVCHTLIIFLLSIPGCPSGYLGPGGRHEEGQYFNCSGGATGYVDKLLLGIDHIYQTPTASSIYGSGPFDPEGVLGCLTSIFQVFLGIQAGQILREYKDSQSRLIRWLIWAVVLGVIGSVLHYSNLIPVNKNLWSISFVMVTTSFNLGLLCICYLLIDVLPAWNGGPFRVPGMNALIMYVGHQVFYDILPFHWRVGSMNRHDWLLAENLWCVGLWTCIAYILHRKKMYFTL